MKFLSCIVPALMLLTCIGTKAETVTGAISGHVVDATTGEPLEFAAISNGTISTHTDSLGYYKLAGLEVGRHNITIDYVGYTPLKIDAIMVGSAHVTPLEVAMTPLPQQLSEVVVRRDGHRPSNSMSLIGGHQLEMVEASRYAGSLDDPARLASTVAGIATDVSSNGLSIHGAAPHLMQWRLEGVEIPNPNHYADIATLGGGIMSALSRFVTGNSDFYAGAAPSQYANALSGVFDMHMRVGNSHRYQHAVQIGALGIEAASEGPIGKIGGASYIINYRYSLTGLLHELKIMDAGNFNFQDLNFKVNLPTKKAGDFSLWGTMLIDKWESTPKDASEWKYPTDETISKTDPSMFAGGLNHRLSLKKGQLTSSLAVARSSYSASADVAPAPGEPHSPYINATKKQTDLIATVNYLTDIHHRWTMRAGATFTQKIYDLHMTMAQFIGAPMHPVTEGDGHTSLISAYTDNVVRLSPTAEIGAGVNLMWLTLNNSVSVQPRLSAKWRASGRLTLSAAAGTYSRMENMDVYFTSVDGNDHVNRDLGFTKSVHATISANYQLSRRFSLTVSPFANYLYDVPSGADDSYSILNCVDFFIDRALTNKGKGKTVGVDLSLDNHLANGWYSKLSVSLFNSRYCGGDGVWHNTRFNRNYIVNLIGGKEWKVGRSKNNILSFNGRLTYQGGMRYSPVDEAGTLAHPDKEVQYDETRAYSMQYDPMLVLSVSASFRINRKSLSHVFGVDVLNAGGYSEPYGYQYNMITNEFDKILQKTVLPNVFYRIEF